jgi:hypothetical protein
MNYHTNHSNNLTPRVGLPLNEADTEADVAVSIG